MANGTNNGTSFEYFINGNAGAAQDSSGITTKAFLLNLATGLGLFALQITGFFLLKSSNIGRRIYQPKTYLVQDRLRVEAIPRNPIAWIRRIFTIKGEELQLKCGLDGYFAIRFLRAMIVIFVPLMVVIVVILLPTNFNGGKNSRVFEVGGHPHNYNVTGLDTLSWQNVAPTQTNRYWAHLVCALLVIGWTLYRFQREKLHFVKVRQQYLTSPEHRMKASARTILVTNIPNEYQSEEKLKALFDVFVDNDDRSRLHVWVNRDYGPLRALVNKRRSLCQKLEKEELHVLRLVNKQYVKNGRRGSGAKTSPQPSSNTAATEVGMELEEVKDRRPVAPTSLDSEGEPDENRQELDQSIKQAYKMDCQDDKQLWRNYLKNATSIKLSKQKDGSWKPVSSMKPWSKGDKTVPKVAYLRAEIARLTLQTEDMLPHLDKEARFKRQNSAFIQFDRQMAANMACALVCHHKPGTMAPRFLHVAPHEILWPNMGLTSLGRFYRKCIAFVLFVGMVFIWGIPATFLGIISQLESLRSSVNYLEWLRPWPSWLISLISGPLAAILLALLIQLVVPALCRKLAVLTGTPTRSRREVVTQSFYFVFLFIELVLVTSISSSLIATISSVINNPTIVATILANDLPKAANYFFNYLIIQALGFSGSVLFQYLRVLYITLIWPWFTQTPRQEAWLQTTIPHQMWANVFSMWTNFAAIGLIYSVVAPLMLIFISAVFCLFWIAYRHNYYYVQRNKVDTHGLLFENALSQLLAGIYVLQITLIGLFFLVRDSDNNAACVPQAIIMIVALCLTAAYHYLIEQSLEPLYELIPVTLEDSAADAERARFVEGGDTRLSADSDRGGSAGADDEVPIVEKGDDQVLKNRHRGDHAGERDPPAQETPVMKHRSSGKDSATTAAHARKTFSQLSKRIDAKLAGNRIAASRHVGSSSSRKLNAADQLGAAISRYPDELLDLTPEQRHAELRAAYQDPVTREPQPIIWLPEDPAGGSEDSIERSKKYGRVLQYSNAGAYLTKEGKCEITQPAPDVRSDWLLDWVL